MMGSVVTVGPAWGVIYHDEHCGSNGGGVEGGLMVASWLPLSHTVNI